MKCIKVKCMPQREMSNVSKVSCISICNLTLTFNCYFPVSLENVVGDVTELERGMEAVRRECEARGSSTHHVLRDFLNNAHDKLRRLRHETKHAQVTYMERAGVLEETTSIFIDT